MKRDPPKLFARQKNKLQDFRKRRVTTSRDVDATRESFDSEIEAVAGSVLNRTPKISAIYQRTNLHNAKIIRIWDLAATTELISRFYVSLA